MEEDFVIVSANTRFLRDMYKMELECFTNPWTQSFLRQQVMGERRLTLAAVDSEGQLLGYAGLMYALDEGHIVTVAVSPAARRRGIASALVGEILDLGLDIGLTRMYLEVRESNTPAQTLYKKLGFKVDGRRPGYYDNPVEDAILMTCYI